MSAFNQKQATREGRSLGTRLFAPVVIVISVFDCGKIEETKIVCARFI